jgi:hypothetical protein
MPENLWLALVVAFVTFCSTLLANRVSNALMRRDIEQLKENDKDKEARLRVVEKHVTAAEAIGSRG